MTSRITTEPEESGHAGMAETTRASSQHGPRCVAVFGNQWDTAYGFRGPLISELVRLGLTVHVIGPDNRDVYRDRIEELGAYTHGVRISRSGINPVGAIGSIVAVARLLRRVRAELLFSYFHKPVIYGAFAGRLAGVRERYSLIAGLGYVFTEMRDAGDRRRRLLGHVICRLYRLALSGNRLVFFQNPDDRQMFLDKRIVRAEQAMRVNGTGVDLTVFRFREPPTDPVTYVLAARLIGGKGIRDYAAAARLLRERGGSFRCVLLGGLDDNPDAIDRAEIQTWVEEGVLEWPGAVDDVRPWLEQCSVYVLPSWYREGVPRSVQEAMAVGRAIVTTDTPGCRETVEPGINGMLVPPRDVERLAAAMERFLLAPDLITKYGRQSRRIAEARYDVQSINRVMLSSMGLLES